MREYKLYPVYGNAYHDLIMYVGGILQNIGYQILMIDHSVCGRVMNCVPRLRDDIGLQHYKGIDYTKEPIEKCKLSDYDLIFLIVEELSEISVEAISPCFLIMDLQYPNIQAIQGILNDTEQEMEFILVLRDYCFSRMKKENYLPDFSNSKRLKAYYQVPLDFVDYTYRIAMEYEVFHGFKNISVELRECLSSIVKEITGLSWKGIRADYKRAEGGRFFAGSILE